MRRYTSVTVRTTPMSMHFWAMSCQSMNWMAPLGHCSAQRPQLMHFVEVRLSMSMRGMFHGHACEHATADAHVAVDHAGAVLLAHVDGMHGAVVHARGILALLAVLDGELARALALAERALAGVGAGAPVVVVTHAHARDVLADAAVVFSVHIISQRWQPEQRARSVTMSLVGVVRISMRPEAMERSVTPRRQHAADDEARDAATGHRQNLTTRHRLLRSSGSAFLLARLLDGDVAVVNV